MRKLSSKLARPRWPKRSPECSTPALLTSRSRRPSSPSTSGSSRASSACDFGAATSSGSTCRRPGCWPARVLSAVALPGWRQVATTWSPPASSWRTISRPRPRLAPVTRIWRMDINLDCAAHSAGGVSGGTSGPGGACRARAKMAGHMLQGSCMSFTAPFRRPVRRALLTTALGLTLGTGLVSLPAAAAAADAPVVDIAHESFVLPNGLRVVVHTDRKAPIVAVNIWYHVGSKDEPAGRSGFAHLFEHLMFQSSENHPGQFFDPFRAVGATSQNGTTNTDRTNYFQNVPTTALDMALWMESDRMGHLLGAIDQAALDEQRGVVQNEKRQRENQPYGQV